MSYRRNLPASAAPAVLWVAVFMLLAGGAAQGAFTELANFGNRTTISVAWNDCDNDGDLDLAVGNHSVPNQLFLNNGNGTYAAQDQFGTGATFAVVWGDYDNDGDRDMAVGRGTNQQNYLYVNNGNGTFTQQSQFGLNRTCGLAWADFDLDGDLDMAVGNGILGGAQQNYLYVNNGNGTFTARAEFGVGQSDCVVWGDFDNDGDPDLAVGNGGFGYSEQNYLYVNNGNGTFTGRAEFGTRDTASMAWGDFDGDGDLDMAVGNWNATGCLLYINNGDGSFAEAPQFGSRDTNTLCWGDADNDGDLDLAVGNGDFESAEQNYLYVNNGDGTFTETPEFGVGSTDGLAWGDSDGDGDLDLACGNEHSPSQNYLYRNDGSPSSYLEVSLVGHRHDLGAGYSNRDGIGAKVLVYEHGFLGQPDHLLGFREIEAHGGFASQNAMAAHFGLPGRSVVSLRILWPRSLGGFISQDLPEVAVGQSIVVHEASVAAAPDPSRGLGDLELRVWPNPITGASSILVTGSDSSPVDLELVDVRGRVVRRFGPEALKSEVFAWDGRADQGIELSAGVYWMLATSGSAARKAKVVLLR